MKARNDSKVTNLLYLKRRLFQSEVNFLGIVCNGLIHHTPKRTVLMQLTKEINYAARILKLSPVEIHYLNLHANSMYTHISKKVNGKLRSIDLKFGEKKDYEEALNERTSVLYCTVRNDYVTNRTLIKQRNVVASHVEQRLKHDAVYGYDGILASSRAKAGAEFAASGESGSTSVTYSPFFICSAHPKPAKEHQEFEKKVFYDAEYNSFISDNTVLSKVESYIRNHNLMSVQEVCAEPYWLVLRKNCKHFLTNVPIELILHSSARSLVKKMKLWNEDEIPITKEIRAYRAYYERVKTDRALGELLHCEELSKDTLHDETMLAKWTKLLNRSKRR